jgi:hypothetical protein
VFTSRFSTTTNKRGLQCVTMKAHQCGIISCFLGRPYAAKVPNMALKFVQQQMRDTQNKKGRTRYTTTATSVACVDDDSTGDGYQLNKFYQLRVVMKPASTRGVNVSVNVCRIIELRKSVGDTVHPRLGIKNSDAANGTAVVWEYVRGADGTYRFDRMSSSWGLVSLLDLGCRVQVEACGGMQNVVRIASFDEGVGGMKISSGVVGHVSFTTPTSMAGIKKPLHKWLKTELQEELKARNMPVSGRKDVLITRVRPAMVTAAPMPSCSRSTWCQHGGAEPTTVQFRLLAHSS